MTTDATGRPRVLVAPDAFKGTFGATEVAEAIAAGIARAGAGVDTCPVADGGEGTLAVLLAQLGGEEIEAPVHDPLGRGLVARFGLLPGEPRTAVVETAAAIGLDKLAEEERDPWAASTRGAGELIVAAARAGVDRILVATGGSATVDGGAGALEAIDGEGGLGGAKLVVLCDVETPWHLCAQIYGPQKGADEATVARLADRLARIAASLPRDPTDVPRTGAAGGLSGALWAAHGARLASGASYVLDACDFDARLAAADAVVVGEGRIDHQSLDGKIIGEIAVRAAARSVAVHAIVGRDELDLGAAAAAGIATVREATNLAEMERAGEALGAALIGTSSAGER
jgi:glycerate kinase